MKRNKEKRDSPKSMNTSPLTILERELKSLRRDLRVTARTYLSRLDRHLASTMREVADCGPVEDLSRERLHQIRDLVIILRNRKMRPEKGRRKDLRKIDMIISDLSPLAQNDNN